MAGATPPAKSASAPSQTALICSFPKTGRTWLRFALFLYLREVAGIDLPTDFVSAFRVLPNFNADPTRGLAQALPPAWTAPHIAFHHFLPLGETVERLAHRRTEPVTRVFLTRAPRQTLISGFHHYRDFLGSWKGDRLSFFADETLGAPAFVRYHAEWVRLFAHEPAALTLSYAQLRADFEGALGALVKTLGLPVDDTVLVHASAGAQAPRMAALEDSLGGFPGRRADADPANPDARRVRIARSDSPDLDAEEESVIATALRAMDSATMACLERCGVDLEA